MLFIILSVRVFWVNYVNPEILTSALKLPNGDGKKEFVGSCSGCHSLSRSLHPSSHFKNWEDVLKWMHKMHGMGKIEEQKETLILNYLSSHFPLKNHVSQEKTRG